MIKLIKTQGKTLPSVLELVDEYADKGFTKIVVEEACYGNYGGGVYGYGIGSTIDAYDLKEDYHIFRKKVRNSFYYIDRLWLYKT